MNDKVDLVEVKRQFREIAPSFHSVTDMLYHIRLLKYVRQPHLHLIADKYKKICADDKLDRLVELGYLRNQQDIYISTAKSFILLKQLKYKTGLLPKDIQGNGSINEINNTKVFIQALKLPVYYALIYPDFEYLRPDALLVRKREDSYKLEFLEVEASKSGWDDWLENKRTNYLKLASCKDAFQKWKEYCDALKLPIPDIKDFKFSVTIIGKIKKDFGIGFNFVERL